MFKKLAYLSLGLWCVSWAPTSSACLAHLMYADSEEFSRVYRNIAESSGLFAAPVQRFPLQHPVTAVVDLETESTIEIHYQRPNDSANVTLALAGTGNVELIDAELPLQDRDGTVKVRFRLTGYGKHDALLLTVSGEHEGAVISEKSKIYLLGKRRPSAGNAEVSSR